jgi:hypothetical protein
LNPVFQIFGEKHFSLGELVTTEMELMALAAEATIGSRKIPQRGQKVPAVMGIRNG